MADLSPKEIANNIHDPKWRVSNLYKITNKRKETVVFKANFAQRFLQASIQRFKAILKARQLGISTERLIYYLDKTIFKENQTTCIIAHEEKAIKKLFRIVRYAYDNMPPLCKPQVSKGGGSMYELYFPTLNSRIYCDLEVRGDTISNLHISEYAFVKNKDKILATIDAVPIDTGEISIESTPNGMNHFHEDWEDADWPFEKFFFPWYFDPDYSIESPPLSYTKEEKELIKKAKNLFDIDLTKEQIAFRRFKIKQKKSFDHFIQEYPEDEVSCFLMSGEAVMDLVELNKMLKAAPEPIHDEKGLRIWEYFDPKKTYVIGCDTAEGVGKDYSVASVICVQTRRQVAQLRGHFKPSIFAQKIIELAETYVGRKSYWPLLAVERNNHGHAVLLALEDTHNYVNLYEHSDGKLGWRTDKVTRPIMINAFIDAVDNKTFKLQDRDTLSECMTLVDNNGKIEALEGKHDDCVVASAIAIQMVIDQSDAATFTENILKE